MNEIEENDGVMERIEVMEEKMTLSEEEFNEIYDSFNEKFPIKKLQDMKLEEYTNLKKDSFCYWVETKTKKLGNINGSTSYKFGIYEYNQLPRNDGGYSFDEKFAWISKYGNTAETVYENVLKKIIDIANYARAGKYEKIDEIAISEMFKWKIAFLYSEKKLINWFSKDALIEFSKYFGNSVTKKTPTSEIQKFLIKQKGNKTFSEFNTLLQKLWDNYHADNPAQGENKMTNERITEYTNLLLENHNLILHGAPGTGKTHLAKEIAKAMGCSKTEFGFCQFHPSYDYTDFVEGLRPVSSDENGQIGFERRDGVFKEFCRIALKNSISQKLESNFDECWESLVELVRENLSKKKLTKIGSWEYGLSSTNSLKYSSVDSPSQYTFTITRQNIFDAYRGMKARPKGGFQKEMLQIVDFMKEKFGLADFTSDKVEKNNKPYVFVIDEINRGEMSKIMGELFFSIDPGYRGTKGRVRTQYANMLKEPNDFDEYLKINDSYGHFFVPENVYIIGTMNDIDRSVESMDFAMRRRFIFKEVSAAESAENMGLTEEAKERMNRINEKIEKIDGLGKAYHIGGAYFLGTESEDDFKKLWELKLSSLIREYLRGLDDEDSNFKKIEDEYFGRGQDSTGNSEE